MKRLASLLGFLLGLACLMFFFRSVAAQWHAFQAIPMNGRVLAGLTIALSCYLLTYLLTSKSWQLMLRLMDVVLGFKDVLQIVTIAQFGKYIPGNVGQHIGRIVLAKRSGIDSARTITSILLETLLLVVAACVCSLAALELLPSISMMYGKSVQKSFAVLGVALLVCAFIGIVAPWSRRRLRHATEKFKTLITKRGIWLSARTLAVHVMSFVLGAASLTFIVFAMGSGAQPPHLSLFGIYAIAWLIGFVVPGAPAGLGIREALLVFGLTPLYGAEVAATSTALFRLVTVLGDGVALLLGLTLRARGGRMTSAPGESGADTLSPPE